MILDLQVRFRKHWHVDQAGVNRGGMRRKETIWGEGVHLFTTVLWLIGHQMYMFT